MEGFTNSWIVWIIMFIVIEGAAIVNKRPGDTLSEHVWKWAKIKNKPTGWNIRRGGLLAGLLWLIGHLVFRVM